MVWYNGKLVQDETVASCTIFMVFYPRGELRDEKFGGRVIKRIGFLLWLFTFIGGLGESGGFFGERWAVSELVLSHGSSNINYSLLFFAWIDINSDVHGFGV